MKSNLNIGTILKHQHANLTEINTFLKRIYGQKGDKEMNENSNRIERKSYEYITLDERKGNPKELFFTWFAASTVSTTLVTGAISIMIGLNFWWASVSMFLGHAIGATIMALHSAQGPKLGIPQLLQSRAQFGFYGVILPMLIVLTMYFGYGSTNTILVGQGINEAFGVDINVTVMIAMIPMVLLAIYGQDIIQKFMKLYTIGYTLIFLILTILVISQLSMDILSKGEFTFSTFLLSTAISITWQITYGPYVSDHSRFMRPSEAKKTFIYSYAGSFLSSAWLMILGAAIATMVVNGNVMGQIKAMGTIGYILVIVITLGVLVINSLNIYGAGIITLSIASNFIEFKTSRRMRIITSVIIGAIIVFASTAGAGDFMNYFQIYLGFILFFIIPWSVINLTDFYILKRNDYPPEAFMEKDGIFGKLNSKTLAVYLVAITCQVPFTNTGIYQGPVSKALGGIDLAWVVGIIISFGAYYGLNKLIKAETEEMKKEAQKA